MSIYIDSDNNIKRYFLEIEKYIPQLKHNPYVTDLERDIYTKKKKIYLNVYVQSIILIFVN